MQPNLELASEFKNIAYVLLKNDKKSTLQPLVEETCKILGNSTANDALAIFLLGLNLTICDEFLKEHSDYEYYPTNEEKAIEDFDNSSIEIIDKDEYKKYVRNDVDGSIINKFYRQLYFMKDSDGKEYFLNKLFNIVDYASNSKETYEMVDNNDLSETNSITAEQGE